MKKHLIKIICLVQLCVAMQSLARAQNPVTWRDTLQAAVKTDTRRIEQSLGRLQTGLEGIRAVASPMGEGDPIRWAQGLPGVTTGADGPAGHRTITFTHSNGTVYIGEFDIYS